MGHSLAERVEYNTEMKQGDTAQFINIAMINNIEQCLHICQTKLCLLLRLIKLGQEVARSKINLKYSIVRYICISITLC